MLRSTCFALGCSFFLPLVASAQSKLKVLRPGGALPIDSVVVSSKGDFEPTAVITSMVRLGIDAPKVIEPVKAYHPAVAPHLFNASTQLTVGLYDEAGNIKGSKDTTGGDLWRELDVFTANETNKYSALKNDLAPLKVKQSRVFDNDPQINADIETVQLPMDIEIADKLVLQKAELAKMTLGTLATGPMVIAGPGVAGPVVVHGGGIVIDKTKPVGESVFSASYDKTWGNTSYFAAFINGAVKNSGSKLKRETNADFGAGGHVFTKQIKLIEFHSNIKRGTGDSYSYLTVLGNKVWDANTYQPKTNLNYTREGSKRTRFWIGPLPVSVGGAIGGNLGVDINVNSPNDQTIQGYAKPFIDSYASADAAVDVWVARAGVEGTLRAIKDNLPATFNMVLNTSTFRLSHILKVENSVEALNGKLTAYLKVRKLLGGWKKYTKDLFSWSGFTNNSVLIDKNVTVQL